MQHLKMALFAMVAPIGACATRTHDALPLVPSGYNFAYMAPRGADIGLVQAFDDGTRTYLQFADAPHDLKVRSTASERPITFRIQSPYVTVDGVFSKLLVSREHSSSTLVNESADPDGASPADVPYPSAAQSSSTDTSIADPTLGDRPVAAIGIPESLQTMTSNLRVTELNHEIAYLQDRIQSLNDLVEETRRTRGDGTLYFRVMGVAPRLVLKFDDKSALVSLEENLLAPLGAAARAANRIYLHGHTDAFVATDAGTDLAIKRTVAVRQLLLSQQVSAARIRLFYRGAGNFIANNGTPEGKAMNRRVEIEFRKW